MPGIGPMELLVLLIIGAFLFGVPIAAVVLIVVLLRNQKSGTDSELRAENQRLRDEIAALKRQAN